LIAVIADIHANLPALEAVLSDVAALGASEIIVNGDLVNRGPSNVAVVERIVELGCVRALTLGNHDDLMRKWVERAPDIPALWFEDDFWRGMAWPAAQLRAAGKIDALKALPLTYRHEQPGLPQLLFSHGSPRHYREGYAPYLDDQTFSEIVGADPAEVFIGSHTHRPYERRVGRQLMLNTGAVGAPFNGDPRAQYLLLHPREGAWEGEFRAVPYDRGAALAAFETSGYLEEGGLSARIFYDELRVARPLYMLFWEWTESRGRPKDWESWDAFKVEHAERFRDPT
jgi:predicted phosphodiesterase